MKTVVVIEWLAPRGMKLVTIASAIVLGVLVLGRAASAQPIYDLITNFTTPYKTDKA